MSQSKANPARDLRAKIRRLFGLVNSLDTCFLLVENGILIELVAGLAKEAAAPR